MFWININGSPPSLKKCSKLSYERKLKVLDKLIELQEKKINK